MQCSICRKDIQVWNYGTINGDSVSVELYVCNDCAKSILRGDRFILAQPPKGTFGVPLQTAIDGWVAYKASRGKQYSERGMQSLISRIKNEVKKSCADAVIKKINTSIEKQYIGICWELGVIDVGLIENFFNVTFGICPNKLNRESARKYYIALFNKFSDVERAKEFANNIYIKFKQYKDSLDDEKWCCTFENFLKKNVPMGRS